ncbi:MAG: glycosyl hydrolase family 8 [Bacteroidota bacterium]|nr:glycosyl hydrolase family 8 [Bacteroidota bacterium]
MRKIHKYLFFVIFIFRSPFPILGQAVTLQVESMTTGGPYAGIISSPFSGVAYYGNGDNSTSSVSLYSNTGVFLVSLRGASNNANNAGIDLKINGTTVAQFTFTSSSPVILYKTLNLNLPNSNPSIQLILTTDNGSSDTYLDYISFAYNGALPPPRLAPSIPGVGAVQSGLYRNMFVEAGYAASDINNKLNAIWNQLFYGDNSTQRLYYPVGVDEAYIFDSGNGDVRSEGMSYGMMICVQYDKQTEFNRLWKWAYNHMRNSSGALSGYFAWQCDINGNILDNNPVPDGEEYFATALYFAANRWGNGSGIYDYKTQADFIISNLMSKESPIVNSVTNMFNTTEKKVVFVPYASSALFTDPSYHLPAFYEVWSHEASTNNAFWSKVADTSRIFFNKCANPTTGLMPDYAQFNGSPQNQGGHGDFRFDAWRCIMNMAVDFAWYKKTSSELLLSKKIQKFFNSQGITSYANQYSLSGSPLSSDHSPGLVACNAVGSLASDSVLAWNFIDELYGVNIPSGQYRYYDGMLYFMSMLHMSGNFKAYLSNSTTSGALLTPNITFNGFSLTVGGASIDLNNYFFTNSNGTKSFVKNGASASLSGTNLSPISAGIITVTGSVASTSIYYGASKSIVVQVFPVACQTITITSPPITITSTVTVSSPPVTITSPPVTVVSSPSTIGNNTTTSGTCPENYTLVGLSLLSEVASQYPNDKVLLYPIPVKNILHLQIGNIKVGQIQLYNILGQVVYEQTFSNSVDMSNFESGTYQIWLLDLKGEKIAGYIIIKE